MLLIREAWGKLRTNAKRGKQQQKPLPAAGKLEQGAKLGENVVRPAKRRAETKRWNREKRYKTRGQTMPTSFHNSFVCPQFASKLFLIFFLTLTITVTDNLKQCLGKVCGLTKRKWEDLELANA